MGARRAGLTRLCSLQERCVAALARVERTDFLSPMCIGEVAHVSAEITYTSKHSVEVQVNVMSENILTGDCTHSPTSVVGSPGTATVTKQGLLPCEWRADCPRGLLLTPPLVPTSTCEQVLLPPLFSDRNGAQTGQARSPSSCSQSGIQTLAFGLWP